MNSPRYVKGDGWMCVTCWQSFSGGEKGHIARGNNMAMRLWTRSLAVANKSRSASYYSPLGGIRQYRHNCSHTTSDRTLVIALCMLYFWDRPRDCTKWPSKVKQGHQLCHPSTLVRNDLEGRSRSLGIAHWHFLLLVSVTVFLSCTVSFPIY